MGILLAALLRIHLSPRWVLHVAPAAPTVGENATPGPPHVHVSRPWSASACALQYHPVAVGSGEHVLDTESTRSDLIVSAYQKINLITL